MLTFFIDPYYDEILSSVFARYHLYSGNIAYENTLEELLGEKWLASFKMFPKGLSYLEDHIYNNNYTADDFIYKNTFFPLYSVFLSKDKHTEVIDCMKYTGNDKIYIILGLTASKFDVRKNYKYCPLCLEEEVELYGEAYFHRIHQVPGVLVCEKHECKLYNYITKFKSYREFIRLDYNNRELIKYPTYYKKEINKILVEIVKSVRYIMNLEYLKYNKELVLKKIYNILDYKGYVSPSIRIKQKKLTEDVKKYYSEKLLKVLNLEINEDKISWVSRLFEENRCSLKPVHAILLITFLSGNIKSFFDNINEEKLPFGKGPWLCLNPVCIYYRKDIIKDIEIERSKRCRDVFAVLKCERCGFTYRRKGPDMNRDDRLRKDRILSFGEMWEEEFKKSIWRKDKTKDIREKFGISNFLIYHYRKYNKFPKRGYGPISRKINDNFEDYTKEIIEYMKENKGCTRSDIIFNMGKQVTWIRKKYPNWIEENFPKSKQNERQLRKKDYGQYDSKLFLQLTNIYNEIITDENTGRITISLLRRISNESFYAKLDRLPKTKAYLEEILEDYEKYKIRKVRVFCEKLTRQKIYINDKEILMKTGVNFSKLSPKCKKAIHKILDKYKKEMECL